MTSLTLPQNPPHPRSDLPEPASVFECCQEGLRVQVAPDYLVLGLHLEMDPGHAASLYDNLDRITQATDKRRSPEYLQTSGLKLQVMPSENRQSRPGRFRCSWLLIDHDLGFELAITRHLHETCPNANVQVTLKGGAFRFIPDEFAWYSWIVEGFTSSYSRVKAAEVRRIDICVDVELPFAEIAQKVQLGHFVSRLKRKGRRELKQSSMVEYEAELDSQGQVLGVLMGQHPGMFRAYNRMHRLQTTREATALQEYCTSRGVDTESPLSRFEWQIAGRHRDQTARRNGMRFKSMNDWARLRRAWCQVLCHDWFRMTERAPQKNNQQRSPVWGPWQAVQKALDEWASTPPSVDLHRRQLLRIAEVTRTLRNRSGSVYNPNSREAQVIGLLQNMARIECADRSRSSIRQWLREKFQDLELVL